MQTKPLGTRLGVNEILRDVGVDPRTPHEPFETEAADLALRVLGGAAAPRRADGAAAPLTLKVSVAGGGDVRANA